MHRKQSEGHSLHDRSASERVETINSVLLCLNGIFLIPCTRHPRRMGSSHSVPCNDLRRGRRSSMPCEAGWRVRRMDIVVVRLEAIYIGSSFVYRLPFNGLCSLSSSSPLNSSNSNSCAPLKASSSSLTFANPLLSSIGFGNGVAQSLFLKAG